MVARLPGLSKPDGAICLVLRWFLRVCLLCLSALFLRLPRYLAMVGQDAKAERILARINGAEEAKKILNDIKNTVTEKKEKLLTYGVLCIFVGVMLSVFQQAVGINAVLYYAPRIYEAMGFDNPMVLTVFNGIVNLGFTCVAIFTVEKLGRKPLLITGSLGMALECHRCSHHLR